MLDNPMRSTLSALLLLLAPVSLPAQEEHGPAILGYLEQVRNETGAPGISAAVSLEGQLVFRGGVGYAELDNRTPADGGTVWNVGSVSKVLAGVAVMQLVESGKVRLDDRIQKYVPSYPEKRAPVTLEQILTHTSGIRHYKDGEFGPYGLYEARHFDDINEAIEHFRDDPLLFEPGTLYWYSSHAFNLLQGVVETASGLTFEEYMRRYVWEPAGMSSSSFDVPSRIVQKRGRGYVRNERGILVNPPYVDPSYKYAGGGMLSTVEESRPLRAGHQRRHALEAGDGRDDVRRPRRPGDGVQPVGRPREAGLQDGARVSARRGRRGSLVHRQDGNGEGNALGGPHLPGIRAGRGAPGERAPIRLQKVRAGHCPDVPPARPREVPAEPSLIDDLLRERRE